MGGFGGCAEDLWLLVGSEYGGAMGLYISREAGGMFCCIAEGLRLGCERESVG